MKFFIVFSLIFSLQAYAALEMNPGLWEVKLTLTNDGKKVNPQAEIKKAFEKMSPEKRKKMESMMASMGAGMPSTDGGLKICLSKEMLSKDDVLMQQDNKNCDMEFLERSSTKVNINFKCKDGSTGNGQWTIKSGGKAYSGQMTMNRAKGRKSEMTHEGKWLSANCGDVKPMDLRNIQPSQKK